MNSPPILFLNGVSSAGKSSLAAALLTMLEPPYSYVAMDQFEGMVQRLWRSPGADRLYTTCLIPMMHACIARFAAAGMGVVVDTLLTDPAWLHDAAVHLAAYPVVLIGVHCALPELQRRERERGDRGIGKAEAQLPLVHPLVQERGGYDLEVDTTATAPEDAARAVLRYLAIGAQPAAFIRLRSQD